MILLEDRVADIQDEQMLALHCRELAIANLRAGDIQGFQYWIHKARVGYQILRSLLNNKNNS